MNRASATHLYILHINNDMLLSLQNVEWVHEKMNIEDLSYDLLFNIWNWSLKEYTLTNFLFEQLKCEKNCNIFDILSN